MGTRKGSFDSTDYGKRFDELASEILDDTDGHDAPDRTANDFNIDGSGPSDNIESGTTVTEIEDGRTSTERTTLDPIGEKVHRDMEEKLNTTFDTTVVREEPTSRSSVDWKGLLAEVKQDGEWYRIAVGETKKIRAAANNLRSGKTVGADAFEYKTRKDFDTDGVTKLFARYVG